MKVERCCGRTGANPRFIDQLLVQVAPDALVDFAIVLRLSWRPNEARAALAEAVGLYQRKSNAAAVGNARAWLAELGRI